VCVVSFSKSNLLSPDLSFILLCAAWAHLILYGEEATKQAQKEGEEAAAAYEQEKKDIAAGKIPEPIPKPKKKSTRKDPVDTKVKKETPKKRKSSVKDGPNNEKKAKTNTKACKLEKEAIGSTVAKGVTKVRATVLFRGVSLRVKNIQYTQPHSILYRPPCWLREMHLKACPMQI